MGRPVLWGFRQGVKTKSISPDIAQDNKLDDGYIRVRRSICGHMQDCLLDSSLRPPLSMTAITQVHILSMKVSGSPASCQTCTHHVDVDLSTAPRSSVLHGGLALRETQGLLPSLSLPLSVSLSLSPSCGFVAYVVRVKASGFEVEFFSGLRNELQLGPNSKPLVSAGLQSKRIFQCHVSTPNLQTKTEKKLLPYGCGHNIHSARSSRASQDSAGIAESNPNTPPEKQSGEAERMLQMGPPACGPQLTAFGQPRGWKFGRAFGYPGSKV